MASTQDLHDSLAKLGASIDVALAQRDLLRTACEAAFDLLDGIDDNVGLAENVGDEGVFVLSVLRSALDATRPPATLVVVDARPIVTCSCKRPYSAAAWMQLEAVGIQEVEAGGIPREPAERLALRNCVCGSTIAVQVALFDEEHGAWVRTSEVES